MGQDPNSVWHSRGRPGTHLYALVEWDTQGPCTCTHRIEVCPNTTACPEIKTTMIKIPWIRIEWWYDWLKSITLWFIQKFRGPTQVKFNIGGTISRVPPHDHYNELLYFGPLKRWVFGMQKNFCLASKNCWIRLCLFHEKKIRNMISLLSDVWKRLVKF